MSDNEDGGDVDVNDDAENENELLQGSEDEDEDPTASGNAMDVVESSHGGAPSHSAHAVARSKAERTTTRYMTKYEKARVLGARALQISLGAPITVDAKGLTDPLRIAEQELRNGTLPIIVRRFLPDGAYEDWKLSELQR